MRNTDFICFGGTDWWYHNRAHIDKQLVRRFAKLGVMLYVNSIVMQKPNINEGKMFFKKVIRKTKSILKVCKKIDAGFWVYSPFSMPVHHIRGMKQLNEKIIRFQICRIARKLGILNPVVLVACPAACDVAIKMTKSKLIYQRTDRFEESSGVDIEVIKQYDQKLKAHADLTLFVSRTLYNEECGQCKNAIYLDHGVDFELFASAEKDTTVPPDMADIPKPIIGYFGAIDDHSVDIVLAEEIADLLPEVSFVYIGTVSSDCTGLTAKRNVWMLGQKDYEQIPQYGKCFDVASLPWVHNRWTEAANPIKVKEYLALGKPFVSTRVFTQVQEYLDVAYVANTPEEFAHCIVKALNEDNPERITIRRKKVEKDTWDSKAQIVLQELFSNNKSSGNWNNAVRIQQRPVIGRMRLLARWFKSALRSLKAGYFDFAANAFRAQIRLTGLALRDIICRQKKVQCNICGWSGSDFYPNVGWGYNEKSVLCPGCDCLARYRSLAVILWTQTIYFSPDSYVIEAGPSRNFQKYCLEQKNNKDYISFDIENSAMEKGDITQMHYQDNIADYFLCFHVLEHVDDDLQALSEIRRVLKSGGLAILQVPVDWNIAKTYEYSSPNPRDVGHIRRYGRDFAQRISSCGFEVSEVSVVQCTTESEIERFGLSKEPVFLAKKVT